MLFANRTPAPARKQPSPEPGTLGSPSALPLALVGTRVWPQFAHVCKRRQQRFCTIAQKVNGVVTA